jgi:Zn-dependent metalloprotease
MTFSEQEFSMFKRLFLGFWLLSAAFSSYAFDIPKLYSDTNGWTLEIPYLEYDIANYGKVVYSVNLVSQDNITYSIDFNSLREISEEIGAANAPQLVAQPTGWIFNLPAVLQGSDLFSKVEQMCLSTADGVSIQLNGSLCTPTGELLTQSFESTIIAADDDNRGITTKPQINRSNGVITFISSGQGYAIEQPINLPPSTTTEVAIRSFLSVHGSHFGLDNQEIELEKIGTHITKDNRIFTRFQQKYEDVLVLGSEFIVQTDSANNVMSVKSTITPNHSRNNRSTSLKTTPSISPDIARSNAIKKIANAYSESASTLTTTVPNLYIYNPTKLNFFGINEDSLVWKLHVKSNYIYELVLVDAHSGEVVLHTTQINESKNRSVYDANGSSGHEIGIPCRLEGEPASGDSECDRVYHYSGDAYDFYLAEHQLDSIDGRGMEITSTVHKQNFCGACWSPNLNRMFYDDALVADDIVGHEITHGVTQYANQWFAENYFNETGAINEMFSDIWGEFIDQMNGTGDDSEVAKWKMGEDAQYGIIRDMRDPTLYGLPDKTSSLYFYPCLKAGEQPSEENDRGGVHYNLGVGSKAAYLMTEGDSFNGYKIEGLGYAKVVDLFFEARVSLPSTARYTDLYQALNLACVNLGYSNSDCQQVDNALKAVEMHITPSKCSRETRLDGSKDIIVVGSSPDRHFDLPPKYVLTGFGAGIDDDEIEGIFLQGRFLYPDGTLGSKENFSYGKIETLAAVPDDKDYIVVGIGGTASHDDFTDMQIWYREYDSSTTSLIGEVQTLKIGGRGIEKQVVLSEQNEPQKLGLDLDKTVLIGTVGMRYSGSKSAITGIGATAATITK